MAWLKSSSRSARKMKTESKTQAEKEAEWSAMAFVRYLFVRVTRSSAAQIRQSSLFQLFLAWALLYIALAALFAGVYYYGAPASLMNGTEPAKTLAEAIYFSFITQSTVGYGDIVPIDHARAIAVIQIFLGMTLHAVILGFLVTRSMRLRPPLLFPDKLVYSMDRRVFWFRFLNVSGVDLAANSITITCQQRILGEGTQTTGYYDVVNRDQDFENSKPAVIEPWRICAVFTNEALVDRNAFNKAEERASEIRKSKVRGAVDPSPMSPLHFLEDRHRDYPDLQTNVTIAVFGNISTTGEPYFQFKRYYLDDIVCGAYDSVNNNELSMAGTVKQTRRIAEAFNTIIEKPREGCHACSVPGGIECPFKRPS